MISKWVGSRSRSLALLGKLPWPKAELPPRRITADILHSFAQRFRKVTGGPDADNQLFTYVLDTDVVISADKAFLAILDECRP
jgi:hypothetical protein